MIFIFRRYRHALDSSQAQKSTQAAARLTINQSSLLTDGLYRLVVIHQTNPAPAHLPACIPCAYRGGVDSTNLKPEQLAKLTATVTRNLRFLGRLQARMERLGFTSTDALYRATIRAHDGTHAMSVALHYLAVPRGVGKADSEVTSSRRGTK